MWTRPGVFQIFEEHDAAPMSGALEDASGDAYYLEDVPWTMYFDGARALHMEKEIGSLEPGKKADFVVLNLNVPNAVPMYDVYSQIVYALKASEVETVVVGGRTLLKDGRLLTVDEPQAMDKAKEYANKVQVSLKQ